MKVGVNMGKGVSNQGFINVLVQSSQDCLYQGYELLICHIPSLKTGLINQDVLELNTYFHNVSYHLFQDIVLFLIILQLRKGSGGAHSVTVSVVS